MKNILKSIFLILCLAFTSNVLAQEQPLANSVLWKIEGNNLKTTSYLMGTIHIMCKEDFEMEDKIIEALEKSDGLVLEVNFSDPEIMAEMQKMMMTGEKLSETLSKDQANRLDKVLQDKLNIGIDKVDQLSLLAVYSMVLTQSITCPEKKMWEMELIEIATKDKKEIMGLESLNGQVDFFANAYPTDEIINQLDIMDEYADVFSIMVDLYKEENISKLGEVVNDPRFMDENAEYWMLEYRNTNWIKKMPNMMKEGSQFFAVGSAHLVGEHGLISSLRNLGYTVTPILD